MPPTYTVVFSTAANAVATVTVPDGIDLDEIEDLAFQELNTSLCHQCGRGVDLGDFEPRLIEDEDGEIIRETPDQGEVLAVQQFREALIAHFRGAESQSLGLPPSSGGLVDAWCDIIADFEPPDRADEER